MPTKPKMVICGNYGTGNLGDEAILRALLQKFSPDYKIAVMSANSNETAEKFRVDAIERIPSGIRSTLKLLVCGKARNAHQKTINTIQGCDVFLIGGGTLFTDDPPQAMRIWGKQVEKALKLNKKVWIYANGLGPFKSEWAKKKMQAILEGADRVSVRDVRSKKWATQLGQSNVELVKDPVLEMEWSPNSVTEKSPQNTVIIVPRYWTKNMNKAQSEIGKFIQYLVQNKGKKVVLVPFEKNQSKEEDLLNKIIEQSEVRGDVEIWENYDSDMEVMDAIAKAELVVGMRLHSLIFAELTKTPFIGIAYMEKVRAFGEELGKKDSVIDLETLTVEKLIDAYKLSEKTD